jgi:hypothetical protein
MSAAVAPEPPGGDIFLESKQKMAAAALTFDGDYPMEDKHRKCLAAAHKMDKDFDSHTLEKLKTPTKLVRGEVCHADEHGKHVIVRAGATIRAPIRHVLGHLRGHNQQYWDVVNKDVASLILERSFDHTPRSNYFVYKTKSPFPPFRDRESLNYYVWEKRTDE